MMSEKNLPGTATDPVSSIKPLASVLIEVSRSDAKSVTCPPSVLISTPESDGTDGLDAVALITVLTAAVSSDFAILTFIVYPSFSM